MHWGYYILIADLRVPHYYYLSAIQGLVSVFFIVFGFFHYRCDIYISFLKKTRAKINAKQVNRIKCYSEIFFFCNLGNAIINHSSYKKGQGVNESMVCFIITWRGGGKPLFRFLIVGRLAWYWYWYSLTTIPENFRKMCWVAFEKFSDKKKERKKQNRKEEQLERGKLLFFVYLRMNVLLAIILNLQIVA